MERAGNSRRGDLDRISNLPDYLLHLIMSFLTAQEAVRTCILSKRWKILWTTLPFLDFDVDEFRYDESEDGIPRRNRVDLFGDFVSTTLLLRESSDLHKFRLSGFEMSHFDIMRSWILYALKHNLQVLNIDCMLECSLPLSVFTCASLVDASLDSVISVDEIELVNLPCLRRLTLKNTDLNQDFIDKLLCGCPMLEFLCLEGCYRDFSTINSKSLKYLEIQTFCFCKETKKKMELINTPNLVSFCDSICPYLSGQKMLLKMPCLTSASIHMDECYYIWPYQDKSNNILIVLSNVQNLELSGIGIKDFLENELSDCPEFSNAKDLSVDGLCLSCHFNLFASFLNHFPYLEKLSLYHHDCSCKVQEHENQESLIIVLFTGKQLKTVEVQFSESDKNFPRVVKNIQDCTNNSRVQIKTNLCRH